MPNKEKGHQAGNQVARASANGNGAQPYSSTENGDALSELQNLLEQAKVEPADALSAKKVATWLPEIAAYQGIARQAALEALRVLIGYLGTEERSALSRELSIANIFTRQADLEAYLASCPAPPGSPKFEPKSLSELLAMPPKQWLIDQVLGAGDILMLYGPPGSGKSFLAVDLIFCACLGRQWAMRFDVTRPMHVAYCAGEGAAGLPQRFAAAAEFYDVQELPGFHFFAEVPQLFTTVEDAHTATIGQFVNDWQQRQAAGEVGQLDLLIIDTLHSATVGCEENSATDMGRVLGAVKAAQRALGCAVLLVHHSNKSGTGERGSSALRGAMDAMLETKPTAGKFAMSCEKLKDGAAWQPQTFDLVAVGETGSVRVWWDTPGEVTKGSKQDAHVENIVSLLRGKPGRRYTASTAAEAVGLGGSKLIFKLLPKAMEVEPGIRSGPRYPERDSSPHNPMMYWYAGEDLSFSD